jgi:quinol-cytochrome oxidoreductase complex cytochrome b subunit
MYCLFVQLITGFFLALWYVPHVDFAFDSVEYIMREVHYGWLVRYMHANGASVFFLVVYLHMFRGIYYSSYTHPREFVWFSGFIILILMMGTAFFGYVLPWGQMSYWAATVITSVLSSIPTVGMDLIVYFWGGLTVDQPTITRVYGFHFFLPFVITGLVVVHLLLLHEFGSSYPQSLKNCDDIPFHPYYIVKDILGIVVFNLLFFYLLFFRPNELSHPDNYIQANPDTTPLHIVPEWYFLPYYGILRSVPNKLGGIVLLIIALVFIGFLPWLLKPRIRSKEFKPLSVIFFWIFVVNCLLLGWSGGSPVMSPYFGICKFTTFFFFFYIYVLDHFYNIYEKFKLFSGDREAWERFWVKGEVLYMEELVCIWTHFEGYNKSWGWGFRESAKVEWFLWESVFERWNRYRFFKKWTRRKSKVYRSIKRRMFLGMDLYDNYPVKWNYKFKRQKFVLNCKQKIKPGWVRKLYQPALYKSFFLFNY